MFLSDTQFQKPSGVIEHVCLMLSRAVSLLSNNQPSLLQNTRLIRHPRGVIGGSFIFCLYFQLCTLHFFSPRRSNSPSTAAAPPLAAAITPVCCAKNPFFALLPQLSSRPLPILRKKVICNCRILTEGMHITQIINRHRNKKAKPSPIRSYTIRSIFLSLLCTLYFALSSVFYSSLVTVFFRQACGTIGGLPPQNTHFRHIFSMFFPCWRRCLPFCQRRRCRHNKKANHFPIRFCLLLCTFNFVLCTKKGYP
jgi:hypothetical protein